MKCPKPPFNCYFCYNGECFATHWWGTPTFAPPHNFEHDYDALKHIKEHYPNAIVYDYYSDNKCKG